MKIKSRYCGKDVTKIFVIFCLLTGIIGVGYITSKIEDLDIIFRIIILAMCVFAAIFCELLLMSGKKIFVIIISAAIFLSAVAFHFVSEPNYSLGMRSEGYSLYGGDELYVDDFYQRMEVFCAYYFKDKIVHIDEDYHEEIISALQKKGVQQIVIDNESIVQLPLYSLTEFQIDWLLSHEHICDSLEYSKTEERTYYILDKAWQQSGIIKVAYFNSEVYFVPEKLFDQCIEMSEAELIATTGELYQLKYTEDGKFVLPNTFLEEVDQIHNRVIKQLMIMLGIFILGYLFCICVLSKDNEMRMFHAVMVFPVGLGLSMFNVLLLNIIMKCYNSATYSCLFIIESVILTLIILKRRITKKQLLFFMFFVTVFTFLALYEILNPQIYNGFDSLRNIFYSMSFEYNSFVENISMVAPYGLFSTSLLSIGNIFDAGVLYVIYSLIYWSVILIMGQLTFVMLKKSNINKKISIVAGVVVSFCLAIYPEMLLHKTWTMNNLPMMLYLSLFIISIYMMKNDSNKNQNFYKAIVDISMTICILTRVEGAVQIAFLLCAMLIIDIKENQRRHLALFYMGIVIAWNALQLTIVGINYNSTFWSSKRGFMLCGIAVFVFVVHMLYDNSGLLFKFIRKNITVIAVVILCFLLGSATLLSLIIYGDMAIVNLITCIIHITDDNNILIWSSLILMFPYILCEYKNKNVQFILYSFIGYVAILYCIVLFRNVDGVAFPLNMELGDSGRRILFQCVPIYFTFFVVRIVEYVLKQVNDRRKKKHC